MKNRNTLTPEEIDRLTITIRHRGEDFVFRPALRPRADGWQPWETALWWKANPRYAEVPGLDVNKDTLFTATPRLREWLEGVLQSERANAEKELHTLTRILNNPPEA